MAGLQCAGAVLRGGAPTDDNGIGRSNGLFAKTASKQGVIGMSWEAGGDRRGLTRWDRRGDAAATVVCVGDSITRGNAGDPALSASTVGWVEQLARSLEQCAGLRTSGGFRGFWRGDEWTRVGDWTQVTNTDPFDVAPFGRGFFSSGSAFDVLTWNKPAALTVARFDLYWFEMPDTGDWQYRIDDGTCKSGGASVATADNRLHRLSVEEPISTRVEIRGFDGTRPCIAPIAGISTYAAFLPSIRTVVHNLGCPGELLAVFCRPSAGDPLTLLDDIEPDLVTVLFCNDGDGAKCHGRRSTRCS